MTGAEAASSWAAGCDGRSLGIGTATIAGEGAGAAGEAGSACGSRQRPSTGASAAFPRPRQRIAGPTPERPPPSPAPPAHCLFRRPILAWSSSLASGGGATGAGEAAALSPELLAATVAVVSGSGGSGRIAATEAGFRTATGRVGPPRGCLAAGCSRRRQPEAPDQAIRRPTFSAAARCKRRSPR